MEKENKGFKNNINREEQREAAKEAEEIKAKYGGLGSHINNVNLEGEKVRKRNTSMEHTEDLDSPESPLLNRKLGKEQEVVVDNKSRLDGEEG